MVSEAALPRHPLQPSVAACAVALYPPVHLTLLLSGGGLPLRIGRNPPRGSCVTAVRGHTLAAHQTDARPWPIQSQRYLSADKIEADAAPPPGICLKGRGGCGGKLRAVTKRLGRAVKSVGGQSLVVGQAGGGGIRVADMPSGGVVGGALGREGGTPLQSTAPFPPPPEVVVSTSQPGVFVMTAYRALIRPSGEDAMGRSCILDSHPGRGMPAEVRMPAVVRMPACHSRRFKGERPIGAATG